MKRWSWALWIVLYAVVMAACDADRRSNPLDSEGAVDPIDVVWVQQAELVGSDSEAGHGLGLPNVGTPVGSCTGKPTVCTVSYIAAGALHTVARKSDGTVRTWGNNHQGQLGDGTTTSSTTPVQVSGLDDVVAVAAGMFHTVALKSDGTVWAWGYNGDGELGDDTMTDRTTPVQVIGQSGMVAVAASAFHTMALKSDGTVWAWGRNLEGQLGDGTATSRTTPVQVSGLNLTLDEDSAMPR